MVQRQARRFLVVLVVWVTVVPAWLLGAAVLWNALRPPPPFPDAPYLHLRVCTLASGEEARYVLYVPTDYHHARPYPLIVFLHGYGKHGSDGRTQLADGLPFTLRRREGWWQPPRSEFLVLFPQGRSGHWLPGSADDELVMSELADVQAHYTVDMGRIYLTGISSGGTGTWNLAVAHPDLWAAIAPVCSTCNPEEAARLHHIPCWCFHGAADKDAPPENPREMMRRLRAAGATPRYTEYPGLEHGIWNNVYRPAELYDWLLQQRRQ